MLEIVILPTKCLAFEKREEKSLFMDTYLNSLDRVALNIELRLENDLKQALDLD